MVVLYELKAKGKFYVVSVGLTSVIIIFLAVLGLIELVRFIKPMT